MWCIKLEIHLNDHHILYFFDKRVPPAATITPGSTVIFDTLDTSSGCIKNQADLIAYMENRDPDKVNPVTGPVKVEGAEVGDTITVTIEDILLKPPGFIRTFALKDSMGALKEEFSDPQGSIATMEENHLVLDFGIKIPVSPMVGTIGVAPAGEPVSTLEPGDHGGNLDLNEVCKGATVHLPVLVPGGMVALGDIHASMGDGEICGTGVEMGASVRTKIRLNKGIHYPRPWIEYPDKWVSYGHGETLEESVKQAVSDMVNLLQGILKISGTEAYMLVSACGHVGIGQSCFGPIHSTAKVTMEKRSYK